MKAAEDPPTGNVTRAPDRSATTKMMKRRVKPETIKNLKEQKKKNPKKQTQQKYMAVPPISAARPPSCD